MNPSDWRTALHTWLQANPKTMPADLKELRQEFTRRFPKERLSELTLETYALGHPQSHDSFCYWLEFKTEPLGSIQGGSAAKFGIWFGSKEQDWRYNTKSYSSPEDALERIKQGLSLLVQAVEENRLSELDSLGKKYLGSNRNSLRAKPLSLYYPELFLPIANPEHLRHFLGVFGQSAAGDLAALNLQLLEYMDAQPEFADMDNHQRMHFLYDRFNPRIPDSTAFEDLLERFTAYAQTAPYLEEERNYIASFTVPGPSSRPAKTGRLSSPWAKPLAPCMQRCSNSPGPFTSGWTRNFKKHFSARQT
jgi:5-methylcytosine-specific restriction protein B